MEDEVVMVRSEHSICPSQKKSVSIKIQIPIFVKVFDA